MSCAVTHDRGLIGSYDRHHLRRSGICAPPCRRVQHKWNTLTRVNSSSIFVRSGSTRSAHRLALCAHKGITRAEHRPCDVVESLCRAARMEPHRLYVPGECAIREGASKVPCTRNQDQSAKLSHLAIGPKVVCVPVPSAVVAVFRMSLACRDGSNSRIMRVSAEAGYESRICTRVGIASMRYSTKCAGHSF